MNSTMVKEDCGGPCRFLNFRTKEISNDCCVCEEIIVEI